MDLPEKAGQEREDAIWQLVQDGKAELCFTPLEIEQDGHKLRIDVAMDAVKIEGIRVAANSLTQQKIADYFGCLLPTAKVCDLIWKKVLDGGGVKLTPHTQRPDNQMSNTSRFIEHSKAIDKQRDGRCGLLWPVGKVFAISRKVTPGKCANYGWHVTSGSQFSGVLPGVKVLQPLATAHSDVFTDYSQLCGGFVKRVCFLDGEEEDLAELLKDPDLCSLISTEGPLDAFMYQDSSPPQSSPSAWRTPLRKGMQGSDVAEMQKLLEKHGFSLSPYGPDGDFGGLTETRVKEFQKKEKLTPDGVVGLSTMQALESEASVSKATYETIRVGSMGQSVVSWQHILITDGLDLSPYGADGQFGASTERHTKTWQKAEGLTADGVVGPATWAKAYEPDRKPKSYTQSKLFSGMPPVPSFGPLSSSERNKIFGNLEYVAAPTSDNPEAIRITNDWTKNITSVHIPQLRGVLGAPSHCKIAFHKKGADQLKRLWQIWEERGLLGKVLTWGGAWNPRFIRGSRRTLSNHAYATAFDINAYPWNRLGAEPTAAGEKGSVMELVSVANDLGFYWGGHYQRRPDGMHFELAKVL